MPPVRQACRSGSGRTFWPSALIAAFLILAHGSLLPLPFYWDETGQFVPASLDILRTGAWIPVSTIPNVHPPGVMAYLALVWSIFGYSIPATRIAMLLIAAFGALVTFLLANRTGRGARRVRRRSRRWLCCAFRRCFSRNRCWLNWTCPRCASRCWRCCCSSRIGCAHRPSPARFWFW